MRTHIEFYPVGWEWRDALQARKRPVEGVGTNDADYATQLRTNGRRLRCPAYVSWSHMLERCHNEKYQQRNPSYVGTTCVKSWLLFSNFRKWYFQQRDLTVQYGYEGSLELDKDILSNARTYGPSRCVLIPQALNSLLLDSGSIRGEYPIGVSKVKGKFRARIRIHGKQNEKSGFDTSEEAAAWRLQMKLKHVKSYPLPPWLDQAKVRRRLLKIVRNQN